MRSRVVREKDILEEREEESEKRKSGDGGVEWRERKMDKMNEREEENAGEG